MISIRDDNWLEGRLENIWRAFFNDIPKSNVAIKWGRRARNRLGSISRQKAGNSFWSYLAIADEGTPTIITINSLFKAEQIPSYVVDMVIAHEVCHYAHGFNSPLPQRFDTPHAHGIIAKEMIERGLGTTLKMQKKWIKENWFTYVNQILPRRKRTFRRSRFGFW